MTSDNDLQLSAEMAAVSVVKSTELVEVSQDTAALQNFQQKLEDKKDKVDIVKRVLTDIDDYKLDVPLAKQLDSYLARADVDLPVNELGEVQGVEYLGRSLLPKEFIRTRLMGCENFLGDFYRKVKEISTYLGISFKDSYLLFTQSVDSLLDAIDLLEKELDRVPSFKAGTDTILLGTRLFNLFKVNGKVNEDWITVITKLNNTISALSTNYYLANHTALNNVISYFGGFEGLTEEAAKERFLLLPKSIQSVRFKECTYPNKENSTTTITAKQSVELMGGAYFVDSRMEKINTTPANVEQVIGYVQTYIDLEGISFENNSPIEYPKIGTEIKTLSSDNIKAIIKLMRSILQAWRKSSDGIEKYRVNDTDFTDIGNSIIEAPMSDDLKSKIQTAFISIVRKNQTELIANRAKVNNYLVLIFNGLIELCSTSITVNSPE